MDTTFRPATVLYSRITSLALQTDGKVIIAGKFGVVTMANQRIIARLNSDGSLDGTYNPVIERIEGGVGISSLLVLPDGKLLVGGYFTTANGVKRNNIARLNPDGTLDDSFDPGTGPDSAVGPIAVQSNCKIFVGGAFTSVNGIPRAYLARMSGDNHAPFASARIFPALKFSSTETNSLVLAPNNAAANVVLDASQSWDADNDPLQFAWYADGHTNLLARGVVATNLLSVGSHIVTLIVSDGCDTREAQVRIEVITPRAAVGQIVLLVGRANPEERNKQALLATLSAAMASFERRDSVAGLNQLGAFQNKVRAQLTRSNPTLATALILATDQIIAAMNP